MILCLLGLLVKSIVVVVIVNEVIRAMKDVFIPLELVLVSCVSVRNSRKKKLGFNQMDYSILIVIVFSFIAAVVDYRTWTIPNWVTYPLAIIGVAGLIISGDGIGLVIGLLTFSICFLFLQKSLGGGDIKFFVGIAFVQPFYHEQVFVLIVFLVACFFVLVYRHLKYGYCLLVNKDYSVEGKGPFGPYILLAVLFTYLIL